MDIISEIRNIVNDQCKSLDNFFGEGSFDHIKSVAYHSGELAKEYGSDIEVCMLAGWLHDIASITSYDLYTEHHIHGAVIAEEILLKFDYPQKKIDLIKKCILNHRGSIHNEKQSMEEICVSDADAVSHFDNIASLLYLAFVQRKLSLEDGTNFVKNKLDRSYNKMSEMSKDFYMGKKKSVDLLFG